MIRRVKVCLLAIFCPVTLLLVLGPAVARQELPAERVYKNIQVLKGVPASELPNLMISYGTALGVNCDYCHIPGAFEKTDKPSHKAALRDIEMTRDLNSRYRMTVDCVSCHHGAAKPRAVAAATETAPTRQTETAETPAEPATSAKTKESTKETASTAAATAPAKTAGSQPATGAKGAETAAAGGASPGEVSFKASYGSVAFDHDRHSGAFDCTICHHTIKDPGSESIQKCSVCHLKTPGSITRVTAKDAAHGTKSQRSCAGCHLSSGSGPTKCAECHKR